MISWEEIDPEEGSGVVHIAPGCGPEDYELSQTLGLPVIAPLDAIGDYVEGFGWLEGKNAAHVGDEVRAHLHDAGRIVHDEQYLHSVPVCWRCKSHVLFRLVDEWFISVENIRAAMREAAGTVTWDPPHMGSRMDDWLVNMGDWCISRKRYWGLPLPFYRCEDCNELTVVGSRTELRERALDPEAVDALPELHKPWIDDIKIRCKNCSAPAARVVEVGDCWLDAGITPFSTLGYFDDHATWATRFPVTWVCEMREQVRLWFYSMLFMSVVLEGRAPYKRVLSHERVISDTGEKFSKTGKMIRFDDAVAEIGADPIRYLFNRQPVAVECRFGYETGGQAQRRIAATVEHRVVLRHVREHRPGRDRRADDPRRPAPHLRPVALGAHRPARERRHRCDGRGRHAGDAARGRSVRRRSLELVRAPQSAPVLARGLRCRQAGMPLGALPCVAVRDPRAGTVGPVRHRGTVATRRAAVRQGCRSVGAPRTLADRARVMGRRRPARTHQGRASDDQYRAAPPRGSEAARASAPPCGAPRGGRRETRAALEEQAEAIAAELNVKRVELAGDLSALEEDHLALDFRRAGPVLRKELDAVSTQIRELSDEERATAIAAIRDDRSVRLPGWTEDLPPEIFTFERRPATGISVGDTQAGVIVALDTRLDDELIREGWARDVVRHTQVLRRDAGLAVSDRIRLGIADRRRRPRRGRARARVDDRGRNARRRRRVQRPRRRRRPP